MLWGHALRLWGLRVGGRGLFGICGVGAGGLPGMCALGSGGRGLGVCMSGVPRVPMLQMLCSTFANISIVVFS